MIVHIVSVQDGCLRDVGWIVVRCVVTCLNTCVCVVSRFVGFVDQKLDLDYERMIINDNFQR